MVSAFRFQPMKRVPTRRCGPLILHYHRLVFQHVGGRGGDFKSDDNAIVSYEGGRRQVVFKPVCALETPFMTTELVARYRDAKARELAHPLVLLSAFVLDLLAIHPVADDNGRVARLVTARELLQLGYGVARYVSFEQQIFETKNGYYASLYESQRRWHEGEHTIWPWTEYLVGALAQTYRRFEDRAARRGAEGTRKQQGVRAYILHQAAARFTIAEIRRSVPGTSDQTIRVVLNACRDAGQIRAEGTSSTASRYPANSRSLRLRKRAPAASRWARSASTSTPSIAFEALIDSTRALWASVRSSSGTGRQTAPRGRGQRPLAEAVAPNAVAARRRSARCRRSSS